jgi:hypothetical protein
MRSPIGPRIRDRSSVTSRPEATFADWEDFLGARLTFSSPRLDGSPIVVRQYRLADDGEVVLPSIPDHTIMLRMGRPAYIESRVRDDRGVRQPGACGILPAGARGVWRWMGTPTVVHVYLSAAWLDGIIWEEDLNPQHVKVLERSRCDDPFLWTFGMGLLRRMQGGPPFERRSLTIRRPD